MTVLDTRGGPMRSGSIMRAFRATAAAFTFFSFFDGSGCRPAAAFLTSPARSRPGRGAAAGITATDCVRSLSSKQQLSLVEVHSPLLQQTRRHAFQRTRGGTTTTHLRRQHHSGEEIPEASHTARRHRLHRSQRPGRSLLLAAESITRAFFTRNFSLSATSSACGGAASTPDEALPSPAHPPTAISTDNINSNAVEIQRLSGAKTAAGTGSTEIGDAIIADSLVGSDGGNKGDVVPELEIGAARVAMPTAAGIVAAVARGGSDAGGGGGEEVGAAAAAMAVGLEGAAVDDAKVERKKWVPPKWAMNLHPGAQAAASVALYAFHMLCLSKGGINFPVQLLPNNYGLTQSVGLDTAVGFAVLGAAGWARKRAGLPLVPPLRSETVPWGWKADQVKKRLPVTFLVLIVAYLLSGWGSQLCEYLLYLLESSGIYMSVAMHRSVQVLLSHMVWVAMGVKILGMALKPFFNRKKGSWVGMKWSSNWLWWVTGGYYVSSALFNMADLANQFVCPLPPDTESVVVKIINPENNDMAAMAVGSIAPCISAPWWEEVLYRGFLLPALTLYLPLKAAVPAGSLLFAAHHMNLQAMLPLSVLGLVWSLLFIYSNNLLVTVLIHAMWNSRVFLGSLLGL